MKTKPQRTPKQAKRNKDIMQQIITVDDVIATQRDKPILMMVMMESGLKRCDHLGNLDFDPALACCANSLAPDTNDKNVAEVVQTSMACRDLSGSGGLAALSFVPDGIERRPIVAGSGGGFGGDDNAAWHFSEKVTFEPLATSLASGFLRIDGARAWYYHTSFMNRWHCSRKSFSAVHRASASVSRFRLFPARATVMAYQANAVATTIPISVRALLLETST
ncbi:hypothetical protein K440DRAFT_664631 [Wilcoxina mikolae CBS 423.85]|nr:hypothetical protein K440DRAFT_664631 [Wilcoxina mikolae CBS 423.85]